LDDGVISKLLKFADDVKLIGQVASERVIKKVIKKENDTGMK